MPLDIRTGLLVATLSIALPSLAHANCANPAGVKGEFFYNDDFAVMQFCDGTDWIGMSGGSGGGGAGVTDGDKGDITVSGSGASWLIDDDLLDFTEFKDALSLDASTDIAISGSQVLSLTNTGTGNSLLINDQASDTTPFVIDASGNVGVGLTAPTQALDVVGKTTSDSFIVKPITGLAAPTGGSSPAAQWSTDGTNVWRATGNVGIGTTAPDARLSIDYGTSGDQLRLTNNSSAGNYYKIGRNTNGNLDFQGTQAATNGFNFMHSDGTSRLYVDGDAGNVGIGTTSPGYTLTVVGVEQIQHVTDAYMRIVETTGNDGFFFGADTDWPDAMVFRPIDNGVGGTPTVMFKTNGNVGIGTTIPSARLHVASSETGYAASLADTVTKAAVLLRTHATDSTVTSFGGISGGDGYIQRSNGPGTGSYDLLLNPYGGNVGIGTTNPQANLEVSGTGNVILSMQDGDGAGSAAATWIEFNDSAGTRTGYVGDGSGSNAHIYLQSQNGSVIAVAGANSCTYTSGASWSCSSDERMKKNIVTANNALAKLSQLRGVTYEWRDIGKPGTHYGLIAQEVEAVFPELVSEDDDGMKQLDYSALMSPVVEALKELKAANNNQASEIKALRAEIEALKAAR